MVQRVISHPIASKKKQTLLHFKMFVVKDWRETGRGGNNTKQSPQEVIKLSADCRGHVSVVFESLLD